MGPRARVLAVGVQHRPGRRSSCSSATAGRRPEPTAIRPATRSSSATSSRSPRRRRSPDACTSARAWSASTKRGHRQAQGRRPRRGAVRAGRRRAAARSVATSRARSSTPRAPGRARTRSAPAACPRPASARTPTASPTASLTSSAPPARATPASASLVVGSGHSAFNAILDLVALRDSEPATQIVWAIRGGAPGRKYGGGGDDQLPARGALGAAVRGLVDDGAVALVGGLPDARASRRATAGSCSPTASASSSPTR